MGFGPMYSAPPPELGYYRGAPIWGGGAGTAMGRTGGIASSAPGIGAPANSGTWHPTVKYMLALVIAELITFALLGRLAGI